IAAVVFRVASDQGLACGCWDDALQVGLLAIRQAIHGYRPAEGDATADAGRFRRYLLQVVRGCVRDLARHERRDESHYCRAPHLGLLEREPDTSANDPARLAELHETVDRLLRELSQLDPATRRLVESLVSGETVHDIAEQEGLAYEQAKRLRRSG